MISSVVALSETGYLHLYLFGTHLKRSLVVFSSLRIHIYFAFGESDMAICDKIIFAETNFFGTMVPRKFSACLFIGNAILLVNFDAMYERKTKDDLECGITVAMRVFGAKWKPCIVDAIAAGYCRPSEIHRQIPAATPRVLDMQLSELYDLGVVTKKAGDGFPLISEYCLTQMGESFLPIVRHLEAWGLANKEALKKKLGEAV